MKTKLLGLFLLMASPILAGGHFFFGFGGGYPYRGGYGYYARPPIVAYAPAPYYNYAPAYNYGPAYSYAPGYGYGGYGYGYDGYYGRPPFAGAIWVGPRYYRGRHYNGYWRR